MEGGRKRIGWRWGCVRFPSPRRCGRAGSCRTRDDRSPHRGTRKHEEREHKEETNRDTHAEYVRAQPFEAASLRQQLGNVGNHASENERQRNRYPPARNGCKTHVMAIDTRCS